MFRLWSNSTKDTLWFFACLQCTSKTSWTCVLHHGCSTKIITVMEVAAHQMMIPWCLRALIILPWRSHGRRSFSSSQWDWGVNPSTSCTYPVYRTFSLIACVLGSWEASRNIPSISLDFKVPRCIDDDKYYIKNHICWSVAPKSRSQKLEGIILGHGDKNIAYCWKIVYPTHLLIDVEKLPF